MVQYQNRAVGVVPIDEDGYTWLVGQLVLWRLPLADAVAMAPDGRIRDVMSVVALLRLALLGVG